MRRYLYRAGSVLGDINAIARGKILERIARKSLWRAFAQLMRGFFNGH